MTSALPHKLLAQVLPQFGYAIENCKITLLGNGLINNTYLVQTLDIKFVLQQLNQQVFNVPLQVTDNADLISAHLKIKSDNKSYPLTPTYQLRSIDNKNHVEVQGQYWRSLHYIPQCYTLESITSVEQASEVARAFARFTAALNDFNSEELAEIIVHFHDLSIRIKQFQQALASAADILLVAAQPSIAFIQSQQIFIDSIAEITKKLPLRVTHNDTKINNLLFSKATKQPVAVIDLDTCMPGYVMHDFGDMVRSCCPSIAEDSAKLDNMTINFEILTALTNAYIAGFNGSLSEIERRSLILGIKLMPFMLSIRFLTDFLNGDQYFKTTYASHNLVRAKNQLQLYRLFCQQEALLTNIVLSAPTSNTIA
ncbi:MAG: Ser/Thr protein kinase RdoA (MazF antagonist) [Cognaticolwellia sp.]|jgi:Ser/Thr protein kinase RdoA (MazF antagonist)